MTISTVRVRHVVLCTSDLDAAERRLTYLFGLAVTQRDDFAEEFGLRNAVFALGDTFIEVCEPIADSVPAARFLAAQRGDAGYMVCIQVGDLSAASERAAASGVRTVYAYDDRPLNGALASARHLHPRDTGGTFFTLEHPSPPHAWPYGGEAWHLHRRGQVVGGIVGVEVAARHPRRVAERIAGIAGAAVGHDGHVVVDCGEIRITEASGDAPDRLIAIDLEATDRDRAGEVHVVARTRIRLV